MKIQTSYIARLSEIKSGFPGVIPIGIVRHPKPGINIKNYCVLAPPEPFLWGLKNNRLTFEHFKKAFLVYLSGLYPKAVFKDLLNISNRRDIVLLCYEKDHRACHRSIVAEWFEEHGLTVNELVFPGNRQRKLFE